MCKVSVIIPVYNTEKYLVRCLESIIKQTLKDIEIICINDGSTDNSLKILEEYTKKDSRIVIVNQENRGLSGARNTGMGHAQGEFIGFVDSDDFIDPDFYEKLYEAATSTNSDIACASIVRENNRKRSVLINYKESKTSKDTREKMLLAGLPKHCYTCNKIYKTSIIKSSKIQFPVGINYEDCAFSPQIIEKSDKLTTVPNITYHYWKNKNSIIKNPTDKNRADCIMMQKFLRSYCEKYNINYLNTKKEYYLFGIKILKICQLRATTKYLLFGIIPILECRES